MVVNITFLSFLLFSMCKSIHDAVNTWINCSFFILMFLKVNGAMIAVYIKDIAAYIRRKNNDSLYGSMTAEGKASKR